MNEIPPVSLPSSRRAARCEFNRPRDEDTGNFAVGSLAASERSNRDRSSEKNENTLL